MAKMSVASVLVVGALLQLVLYCSASQPVHIHLSLDGTTDQRFEKRKFDYVVKYSGNNDEVIGDMKQGQTSRLYISGDFEVITEAEHNYEGKLGWHKNKYEDAIAKIVTKMFNPNDIVIVVFPYITQLYSGIVFLKSFEKKIQETHKDISIGREKIHFYFFLDQHEKDTIEPFKKDTDEDHLISIAGHFKIKDNLINLYNFGSGKWNTVTVDSVSQVLIHEADTVMIQLMCSTCVNKDSELTVGGLTAKSLAEILLKVVKPEDPEQTHPRQTVRVKLPNDCGVEETRHKFTEELIDSLKGSLKGLDVYGKEPSAAFYFVPDDGEFLKVTKDRMNVIKQKNCHILQYLVKLNGIEKTVIDKDKLKNIKELFLEFHCHGKFYNRNTVCELDPKMLAKKVNNIISGLTEKTHIQIVFYACNVGTETGQKYIRDFVKECQLDIEEVIAFKSWIQPDFGTTIAITVALQDKYKATNIIDKHLGLNDAIIKTLAINPDAVTFSTLRAKSEDYAFGRFTIKLKKSNDFECCDALPKTELALVEE